MFSTDIILAIFIVLWLLSSLALLHQRRRFAKQRRQFSAVSKDLDQALRCLNGTENQPGEPGFTADLEEAAIKTKLRHYTSARLSKKDETGSIPERYRHVSTLANHGLDNDAISAILQIPKGEAEQLLKLYKLAGQPT
jgi:hypothetical protein